MGAFALPATATAISGQDQTEIGYLRQFFQIDSASASYDELAQLLDSKQMGPSVRGDVACVVHGEDALDDSAVDQAVMGALDGELQLVIDSNSFANTLIGAAATRLPDAISFLLDVHDELKKFGSQIPLFVKELATLYSYKKYKELLVLYHSEREEGKSAEEVEAAMRESEGIAIEAVDQERSLSEAQLFAQYSYSSDCMTLAENSEDRLAYGEYVKTLIGDLRVYSQKGGETPGGLAIVQSAPATLKVINGGEAPVDDLTIKDQAGDTLAQIGGELPPGEVDSVGDGGASPATVEFSVDGIEGVKRPYSELASEFYAGEAFALQIGEDSLTQQLSVEPPPEAAENLSPTYKWELGEANATADTPTVVHTYSCYGQSTARFTATAGSHTASRTVTVDRPPPFTLDWSTAEGEMSAPPGVPLTFQADSSVPTGDTIRWEYGDGKSGSGREVSHTFTSDGTYNVTMLVEIPGSSCPALSVSHPVTVAHPEDWVMLSGTLPTQKLKPDVAGYVFVGPVTIAAGHTLTIGPGVNVKFESDSEGPGQLLVRGTLKVAGSAEAPAVFTSRYDDSAGGHCTCAPTGHSPAPGDWYGITVLEGAATIEHADVRYAQADVETQSSGGSALVDDSVLSDAGSGLRSRGVNTISVRSSSLLRDNAGLSLGCFGCSYSPSVVNDVFEDDQIGVELEDHVAPRVDHGEFVNVSRAAEGTVAAARTLLTNTKVKGGGGFVVLFGGLLPTGSTWLDSDLPYVLIGESTLPSGSQLTIGPRAVVRFAPSGFTPASLIDEGSLIVAGSASSPATLTSAYDESQGGPCSCVPSGHTPASGDWRGVILEAGASALFEHADVRYPGTGLELRGAGAGAQVADSTIEDAGTGLSATAASSSTVESSTLRDDEYGVALSCACTASISRTGFPGSQTGALLAGQSHLDIHGSTFEAQRQGVIAVERASADARENWWGAASGPSPAGAGASVSGNVEPNPFCLNDGCAEIELTLSQSTVLADGRSQSTATIAATTAGAPRTGDQIALASSDSGETIGPVREIREGVYTATITASHALGAATVTAIDGSVSPAATVSATLTQVAPTMTVTLAPTTIADNGTSQSTATVLLAGPQGPLAGEPIAIESSDPAEQVSSVTDDGDGSYTATITSSRQVESATITARDSAYGTSATATLTQAPARKLKLSLKPASLTAGAPATSTATVSVSAGGGAVSGDHVVLEASDPAVTTGPVLDDGNGTYTATIVPSATVGPVTIIATDTTVAPYATATATLEQTPPTIKATLKPKTIPADGAASTTVTVKVAAKTVPLPGQQIVLTSSDPGELIGPVLDEGDGTYRATVTASLTPGTATITASDLSVSPAATASVTLTQS